MLSGVAQGQDVCRVVEQRTLNAFPKRANDITESGEYCLRTDYKSNRVYAFSEGGERSYPGYVLTIKAANVVFDLRGFTMNVETRGIGGVKSGYWKDTQSNEKITIRNGTIKNRLPTGPTIDFNGPDGSTLSDFLAIYEEHDSANRNYKKLLNTLPQNNEGYPKTEHLIDRMKIEAGTVSAFLGLHSKAIAMKGAANTIRNSTIVVTDGHAAIYLFGPNQLIENNIIIFKGKAALETSAAIKLHQADGTIIRNNDIIIDGSGDEGPKAAISLIDSKDVVVEGNRIYGTKALMQTWDDKSTIIDKKNEFRSMLRRPLMMGQPGVH